MTERRQPRHYIREGSVADLAFERHKKDVLRQWRIKNTGIHEKVIQVRKIPGLETVTEDQLSYRVKTKWKEPNEAGSAKTSSDDEASPPSPSHNIGSSNTNPRLGNLGAMPPITTFSALPQNHAALSQHPYAVQSLNLPNTEYWRTENWLEQADLTSFLSQDGGQHLNYQVGSPYDPHGGINDPQTFLPNYPFSHMTFAQDPNHGASFNQLSPTAHPEPSFEAEDYIADIHLDVDAIDEEELLDIPPTTFNW